MMDKTPNTTDSLDESKLDSSPPAPVKLSCPFCQTKLVVLNAITYNGICCSRCFKMFRIGESRHQPTRRPDGPRHPDSAITAGLLGLFSPIPLIGIVAVFTGAIGLMAIKKTEKLKGEKWCWFGIVAGGLATLAYIGIMLWLAFFRT